MKKLRNEMQCELLQTEIKCSIKGLQEKRIYFEVAKSEEMSRKQMNFASLLDKS